MYPRPSCLTWRPTARNPDPGVSRDPNPATSASVAAFAGGLAVLAVLVASLVEEMALLASEVSAWSRKLEERLGEAEKSEAGEESGEVR